MRASNRGSSIVEVSVGLGIAMIIGLSALKLLNDQSNVIRSAYDRSFITREGGNLQAGLTKLVGPASLCTVHNSLSDAQRGVGATRIGGSFIRIWGETPLTTRVIGFSSGILGVYNQSAIGAWATTPSWNLSRGLTGATFDSTNGVIVASVAWPGGNSTNFGVEGLQ